ncbi:histone-like nucleoid-structuring protein Lsr2 [Streptomyces sp. NPDC020983]|uniref:Lsr2 family DNA-binding protein n=1 Tax=Streptomyces sp. NPDC020983 TaxID=3365106 RepID=UPI0037B9BAED
MAGGIYVARKSAALVFAGKTVFIEEGSTMAREGHPILDAAGEMFQPVFVHFEVDGEDGQTPAPEKQEKNAPVEQPAAKDVRAWAKEQGIEVPVRGAVPQDVTDAYVAAHQGA